MKKNMNDMWKIIHIPDKPPIPPNQQPTVNVLASIIDPKHANTLISNIDGITGFSEEDSLSVLSFMKVAIELAKSVIVDPSVQQIITNGCDQIFSWHAPMNKTCIRNDCIEQSTNLDSHQSNGVASPVTEVLPNASPSEPESLSCAVSCLNPWKWSEQRSDTANSYYWHPLRHAAVVAIESSADRDRRLFPGLGDAEEKSFETSQSSHIVSMVKRQKTNVANVEKKEVDPPNMPSNSVPERPYLCTGWDIYLVWEPCIMCAMALVHQRIRRIFYAFPNPNTGALGSLHRLQGEKSLNHHYAVFRICVPEEVLDIAGNRKSC